MTTIELERIARQIIPPVGATMAIARVDEKVKHRAAFLIDGKVHGDPVGPAFDRPRDAIALVNLLNGEAPRPASDPDLARDRLGRLADRRDADPAPPEAPVLGAGASLGPAAALPPAAAGTSYTAGTCPGCGGPLPHGRRGQWRATCSDRCRRRVARANEDPILLQAKTAAWSANANARALGVSGTLTAQDVVDLWTAQPVCLRCGNGRGLDHISPMASGGTNDPSNIQNLCLPCNDRKASTEAPIPPQSGRTRRRKAARSRAQLVTPSRPSTDPSSRAAADTLRRQLEATDPTDLSDGQTGVPLSLGF